MSKVNFFTELFPLLEEKESIELKVQRTGDELTVLLVPKIKGKTATIVLNGTAEELNDGFMEQLIIPVDKIKGLVSNASEVKIMVTMRTNKCIGWTSGILTILVRLF